MKAERARLICVVDDDDAVRASTKVLLEAVGYAVRDYAGAQSVLTDDAAADADCFVLDFQLGGMTGLALVDRLRARGIRTAAIIVTADASLFDARHTHPHVLAVLRKPAPADELLGWIAKACSLA